MKKWVLTIIFALSAISAHAEIVVLKNGQKLEGKILARTTQLIRIDLGLGVDLTYYLDQIDQINGDKIKVTGNSFVNLEPQENLDQNPPPLFEEKTTVSANDTSPQKETNQIVIKEPVIVSDLKAPDKIDVSQQEVVEIDQMNAFRKFEKFKKIREIGKSLSHMLGQSVSPLLIFGIGTLFFIILWIFACLPFYLIAKNLQTGQPWMAWFPLLQLFLFIRLAGVSLWWIVLFLVPFVNIFVPLILWFKIAKALDKPTWLAILMYLPLINYIVLWYFALSKPKAKAYRP